MILSNMSDNLDSKSSLSLHNLYYSIPYLKDINGKLFRNRVCYNERYSGSILR